MSDRPSESDFESWSAKELLGVGLMLFAVVIFALLWMDRTTGLPFDMPSSWFKSRLMLFIMALFALPVSYVLMRRSTGKMITKPQEQLELPNFKTFRFYSRANCHLCDEALELIRRYENLLPEIEIYDIDADPELRERFTTCVPVVEIDGKVRFRGHVNEILFRRLITASARTTKPVTGKVVPLK
ncbi:MAG: glutaredoxin family protein [Planctomycetaceae bacterium]